MIVDASVAFKWFVQEADSDRALRLTAFDLVAPDLIYVEVANAIWKKQRRGEATQLRAIGGMDGLLAGVVPVPSLAARAGQLARELDHPAYDCFYLALALREDLPLVTADLRFIGKCAASPYRDRVVALADWTPA